MMLLADSLGENKELEKLSLSNKNNLIDHNGIEDDGRVYLLYKLKQDSTNTQLDSGIFNYYL